MKATSRFREASLSLNYDPEIQFFPEGTRTAIDAAKAVGCELGQIVKSLVFIAGDSPILILASGKNRVDEERVLEFLGTKTLIMASPKIVKRVTGFSIGGTPPFGHSQRIQTIVDSDLISYEQIWAAAGTPDSCFPITPAKLCEIATATVSKIN